MRMVEAGKCCICGELYEWHPHVNWGGMCEECF